MKSLENFKEPLLRERGSLAELLPGQVPALPDLLVRAPTTRRKVVITGIGVVSPVGIGVSNFWDGLLSGNSGVSDIELFDVSGFPSKIGGEVKNFESENFLSKSQARRFSRVTQFAVASASMALEDCSLEYLDPYRTDTILGSASCAFDEVDKQVFRNPTAGKQWVDGAFQSRSLGRVFMNAPACAVSLTFGIGGHVTTLSSACASGLNAVGMAAERIEDDRADVAIAGGVDCAINHFTLNIFTAAGALYTEESEPSKALCPFDQRRTRSVLAEAAGIFVLEEKEHALARGANIYGEIASYVQEYENFNELYLLDKSGELWSKAIKRAAWPFRHQIGYISAHAPSDIDIDLVESKALEKVFGNRLETIPISSIKGATGSALGAAGALQLASSLMALKNKVLPPTCNHSVSDPDLNLKIVSEPQKANHLSHVLINSHAFGGVNSSLVVKELSLD